MFRPIFSHFSRLAPDFTAAFKARSIVLGLGARNWAASRGLFPGISNNKATAVSAITLACGLATTPSSAAAAALVVPGGMHEMGMLGWFVVDLAINVAGWAAAAALKTEKFFDALGSASFLTLTAGSLLLSGPITPRKVLVSCMAGVWAVRLGSYLVHRIHKAGKDSRFDEVKHQPLQFLVYWVLQAAWVFVTLSPVLIVNGAAATAPLVLADLLGVGIFAAGISIEAVADWQKDEFRSRPENKGKFITEGLWSWSRHPNYFGECLLWWGVFLTSVRSFTTPGQFASVASPLFVFALIRFMSGVPILEKQADARWGHEPEYQRYKETTPVFFPYPPVASKDK